MHFFHEKLEDLSPFILTEKEFKNSKHKKKIQSILNQLEARVKKFTPKDLDQAPGFNVTYKLLGAHLSQAKKAFEEGEIEFARHQLSATTNFCTSCHGRLPIESSFLDMSWMDGASLGANPKEVLREADVLFIERKYKRALRIYSRWIRSYKGKTHSPLGLTQALQKKLIILTRVYRNPKGAIESFQKDLSNKDLPLMARGDIETWVSSFKDWQNDSVSDLSQMSEGEFLKRAQTKVESLLQSRALSGSSPGLVPLLRISGHLYEKVWRSPQIQQTPFYLYLLARSELKLDSLQLYSLSQLYLQECMDRYPRHEVAHLCCKALSKSCRGSQCDSLKCNMLKKKVGVEL